MLGSVTFTRLGPLLLLIAGVCVMAMNAPRASAVAFDVDTIVDDPTKDGCGGGANDCSLRGAISKANDLDGPDVINLQLNATYVLDEPNTDEDLNADGDLDVTESVTVHGNNATIDANDISRVMELYPAVFIGAVTIEDLTITDGNDLTAEGGGGISIEGGTVLLENVTVRANETNFNGGGILIDEADVTLRGVTAELNESAQSGGGVIFSDSLDNFLEVYDGTFTDNTAGGDGGGLMIGVNEHASVQDSIFTGNEAGFDGGGLAIPTFGAEVINSEFMGNSADQNGGGLSSSGEVSVRDGIFTGNSAESGGGLAIGRDSVVQNTVIRTNTAIEGGGLRMGGGTLVQSEVSQNDASAAGGGVFVPFGNGGTIENTTISDNEGLRGGGIHYQSGVQQTALPQGSGNEPLILRHVTLGMNNSPTGGSVFNAGAASMIQLRGSIVADDINGDNCVGPVTSLGHNVADDDSCELDGTGDKEDATVNLAQLANNGADTRNQALGAGSEAIDAVWSGCPPPADDQRGVSRPDGNACDAGAFESAFSALTPTASPTPSPTPSATPAAEERLWGDTDCDDDVDGEDALLIVAGAAGLPGDGLPAGCPELDEVVDVAGEPIAWGDIDCDGTPEVGDVLPVLAHMADLSPGVATGCPEVGATVVVT